MRDISVGDEVRIRSAFIPPCPAGTSPVHSRFVKHIRQHGNRFTVTRVDGSGLIHVFEVGILLETRQVERASGKFLVVNLGK